jgi:hypothetical protein
MIYSYNILGVYTTKENRQFDNTGNQCVLHHFETNKIPSIQLIIDDEVAVASYRLLDNNDNEVQTGSITVEPAENDALASYSRLILNGATTTAQEDGFYYLEITYDATIVYMDVFSWKTDLSKYLKIKAESTNIFIGEFEINLDGFDYLVYLDVNGKINDYELEEEGVEKTYGNLPLFGSRNKISEFTITGYSKTHDFLSGLRLLWTNGTVTFTYKGDEFEVYDIENPDKNNSFGDSEIIILGLKVKRKDYLQTKNAL